MPGKEYEGKNEKELVKEAAKELGIDEAKLRVTVLEKGKGGFLGLKKARIRVEYDLDDVMMEVSKPADSGKKAEAQPRASRSPAPANSAGSLDAYEKVTVEYLAGMFDLMGFDVDIEVDNNGQDRVFIELFSPDSGLIIGKRGKTLESLQMLVNTVGSRVPGSGSYKCVIDIENYRAKRETILTDLAHRVAQEVIRSGRPKLLEPMNPFERRLIHLALQNEAQVETRSEGEGVHRKVKISLKQNV
jgi:spoIIIJ-associated protein